MSDFTDDYESIEARLSAYGTVLQGHLDGVQDDDAKGMLLLGGFGADATATIARRKPAVAVLSTAAAILVAVGLLLPSLVGNGSTEPITVNGGDFSSAPEAGDGADGLDDVALGDNIPTDKGDGPVAADGDKHVDATDSSTTDEPAGDHDWSSFSVTVGGAGDERAKLPDGTSAEEDENKSAGTAAASAGADHEEPAEVDESDKGQSAGEPGGECPEGKEKRDGVCVVVGTPPTVSAGGCPAGAVALGQQCYEIVPPSCGDLQIAPGGDGCLKLVGAANAQGGCPDNYELEGSTCIKLLAAPVSCTQGTPSGSSCLIKENPTGGIDSGCAEGQTQFGSGCYELSNPSVECDGLVTLADGNCRLPVDAEQATECAAGLQAWENICYRYEDPPTYDCAGGESDGAGWCLMTEAATPGPDGCDDGVLQDEQGCYVLVDVQDDGTCGGLPELDGKCRKAKASFQTWTCSDGKTVYEPTCKVWAEAVSVTCLAGEPVENNTKCKTIEDPITTDGCPSYALEDSQGCYKSKEPQLSCGDLAKTPDGHYCKTWVSDAESDASCRDGFDLVGDYCKKYVDGTPGTCSGAETITVNGVSKCKYTTSPTDATTGCADGAIEQSGNCYIVVAASCEDLDTDLYGKGCKKPIDVEPNMVCEAGFHLVGDECIKKS